MPNEDMDSRSRNWDGSFGDGEGVGDAESRIGELEAKVAESEARNLRLLADHQNFVRRALQNEVSAELRGVSQTVHSIVGVIDHFDLALSLDPERATAQQVIEGVRVIRAELIKALNKVGVVVVAPGPNEEFRPGIHEAIMQQAAPGVQSGRVSATFQAGYVLGDRPIRPAKVAVAP